MLGMTGLFPLFNVWKCTFSSRNQPQQARDVKSLKSEEKVPAGGKNTRRLFAALASGDPVPLKRQRSVAWRCQRDEEHMTADIVGSDSALLPTLKWEKPFPFAPSACAARPDLHFASFCSCCSSELDFIRLLQDIKPLGLRPRSAAPPGEEIPLRATTTATTTATPTTNSTSISPKYPPHDWSFYVSCCLGLQPTR